MFGLESGKKKKATEFIFDLETKMKDPKQREILKNQLDQRLQKIQNTLRTGGSKEDFDQFEILLKGYTSLIKVLGRIPKK